MELDTILNMDCLEGMKQIGDASVDAIICDLPYGTTQNGWDSIIPLDALWEQYRRVIKPAGAIVLFSQMPFTATLACSNLEMLKYEWIWEKESGTGFLNSHHAPLKIHENILVFSPGSASANREGMRYNPQFVGGGSRIIHVSITHRRTMENRKQSQLIVMAKDTPLTFCGSREMRKRYTQHRNRSTSSATLSGHTPTKEMLSWTTAWEVERLLLPALKSTDITSGLN